MKIRHGAAGAVVAAGVLAGMPGSALAQFQQPIPQAYPQVYAPAPVQPMVQPVVQPVVQQQCCLTDFFAGLHSCFRRAPQAYAVAPVAAPLAAPVAAPIPAPPPPVMVPVQQVSYVPETTYRTEYRSVPVTSYKPSSEIDPCTGCPRDCVEPVTSMVQQAVNVPVTQYRAVYSTKYVQMQPQQGYAQPAVGTALPAATAVPQAPAAGSAWVPGTTAAPAPVASPFAAPAATAGPQGWGAAGADIPQQVVPGQSSIAAPALPQGTVIPANPQIVPQSGTYAPSLPREPLERTAPPTLNPTPALRPITEAQKPVGPVPSAGTAAAAPAAPTGPATTGPATTGPATTGPATTGPATSPAAEPAAVPAEGSEAPGAGKASDAAVPASGAVGTAAAPRLVPIPVLPASPRPASPSPGPAGTMPTVPGAGPGTTTGAFPRLLDPTAHTTSWQVVTPRLPTAALPGRPQQ